LKHANVNNIGGTPQKWLASSTKVNWSFVAWGLGQ